MTYTNNLLKSETTTENQESAVGVPSIVQLSEVIADGGELIDEEVVDPCVDGGYWNIYSQTYETPTGIQYIFDCQGDNFSDTRVEHECMEIIQPNK